MIALPPAVELLEMHGFGLEDDEVLVSCGDEELTEEEVESMPDELREIYELFPSGPAKGACKVAGLPKPTGCV